MALHDAAYIKASPNLLGSLHDAAYIKASPNLLGLKGQTTEWVNLEYGHPNPSDEDWIGVFSPAKFRHIKIFMLFKEELKICHEDLEKLNYQVLTKVSVFRLHGLLINLAASFSNQKMKSHWQCSLEP
ncbi:uncharacterized protein A4U43_C07F35080 [Asparagus officinalis]|uniref:Purple acid phosphatase Fn3-like domain-containing protein n=1 Tax=Asparagus officinalis TaxID=4686 RepID=A0A5P1EJ65_ASPOF|nr:uncharacterized protein A4U43_C07F35080 [Asparagus officinalis]